jgi:hypothetical protein
MRRAVPFVFKVPQSAEGSIVQRDGLVHPHAGNVITPAKLSRKSPGDWLESLGNRRRRAGGPVTVNIYVAPGAKAADDPAALAVFVRTEVERAVGNGVGLDGDRLARLVAHSAARDSERR